MFLRRVKCPCVEGDCRRFSDTKDKNNSSEQEEHKSEGAKVALWGSAQTHRIKYLELEMEEGGV